jgi:hypothetical protein
VSAPLVICVDWIIYNLLSASNASSTVDVFPDLEFAILPANAVGSAEMRNRPLSFSASNNRERHQIAAERDYQRLRQELFLYHRNITDEGHQREIERLWALSGEGQRLYWDDQRINKNNRHRNNNNSSSFKETIGGFLSGSVVYVKLDKEMEKKEKESHITDEIEKHDPHGNYNEGFDSFEGKEDSCADFDSGPLHLTNRRSSRKNYSRKNRFKTKNDEGQPETVDGWDNRSAFNAVKYLFLSYRMAEQYPDLQASQIILQYSSPWPKQDYNISKT